GGLWVGTDHGLNLLRGGRIVKTYTRADGLPSNDVRCLLRDSKGTLWVGTSTGAAELRGGAFARPKGLSETEAVQAIGEDGAARIYVATANDVLRLNGEKSEQ